jgi:two-component system, OmpR family, phosphate regulon sensor histidine kinase PhoR
MRINKKHSFQYKLVFSYIFIILFSFGFAAFFLDKNLEEKSLQEIKSSLINQAYLIEVQIPKTSLIEKNVPQLEALTKGLSPRIKARLTVVNNEGKVLAESEKPETELRRMENHAGRPEIKTALAGGTGEAIRYSATLKIDMLYIALPIRDNNVVIGAVRLALPLVSVHQTLSTVRRAVLISLFFALGLAFILGSLLTKAIIRPINKIINISRRYSTGDFSHKISLDSQDEIQELAETLNGMASNLKDKISKVEVRSQQLKAILESMVEGLIVTDNVGRILSLNSAAERIFNISSSAAQGRIFLEVAHNNDIADIINYVLTNAEFKSCELSLVWPLHRVFEINATPIFENGAVSACLLVIHDITEIRRLETMRKDFIANVSHELKTPLTSIKGFVETLLEGALEDKENNRHFLEIIREHANRLDVLISDLLNLSHLESKEITLDKEKLGLKALVDDILDGFKTQLEKKHIEIRNELGADTFLAADKNRIGQVFINLIDNAIKFNKENGSVRIYSRQETGKIKVIVEDTGFGIPAKDLPRIFERFYRVDKARSRELGGTGLGLSIVKHIVELHGGSAAVESTEGLGSKFFFILPQ